MVVRLLGGGHRRGWGGFGCGVLWWVEIGVEVQVEVAGWWVLWRFCGGFWLWFVLWVFFSWWLGVEVVVGGGGCSCDRD